MNHPPGDRDLGVEEGGTSQEERERNGVTRRTVLQGASSAGVLLGTAAWAAGPITVRKAPRSGNIDIRRDGQLIHTLQRLRLGPGGRFDLDPKVGPEWTIHATGIQLSGFTFARITLFVDLTGTSIRAEMERTDLFRFFGGRPFDLVPFEEWRTGKVDLKLKTPFEKEDANVLLQAALPRGANVTGEMFLALCGDLSWRALPATGATLSLENRRVAHAEGIHFGVGIIEPSRSPFRSFAPADNGQAASVFGEAKSPDDREIVLGATDDHITLVAVPTGPLTIKVEKRASQEELAFLEGPARIEVRMSDADDAPRTVFDAQLLHRWRSVQRDSSRSEARAWIRDGMHSVTVRSVPLVVQGVSAGREDHGDIEAASRNARLEKFDGRFQAQQVCVVVPGADYSRFHCGLTPLRFRIDGVEPVGVDETEAVATLGQMPLIDFPLGGSRLDVRRFDDMLDLKFRFKNLSLVIAPDQVYLTPRRPRVVEPDAAAILAVEFPPQHVAERAYFIQKAGDSQEPGKDAKKQECTKPAAALMFPEKSDSWFGKFKEKFDERTRTTAALNGLNVKYNGSVTLRAWPEHAKLLRDIAIQVFDAVRPEAVDHFDEITQARLSGPSRVAFRIPYAQQDGSAPTIAFDLDALTDWREFDLAVVRRAEGVVPPDFANMKEALELSSDTARLLWYRGFRTNRDKEPSKWLTPSDRMDDVVRHLKKQGKPDEGDQPDQPDDFQTSIELPFRLILSPSRQARFLTPRPRMRLRDAPDVVSSRAAALWTAELDWTHPIKRRGIGDVRAVWSKDFRAGVFGPPDASGKHKSPPPHGAFAPWEIGPGGDQNHIAGKPHRFRTALDAYDRHEIVVLSSVYGLPVQPSREGDGKLTGDQIMPPGEFVLRDGSDVPDARQQAIYEPQPLGVRELALSALGGNLDLEATFVPPSAVVRDLFPTLTVERWRQRTVLGRDILVEVVYKGFLFPIGHRCSLVKLTERVFEANPRGGHPTAYLTQRMFLRTAKPSKDYPAIGQPFEGRAWPARSITLVTRRTPDIVDPYDAFTAEPTEVAGIMVTPTGRLGRTSSAKEINGLDEFKGLVFWPRTAPCRGSEVSFEIRIDDSADTVHVPLLFLDNTATEEPDVVKEVVRYYNALGDGANPARWKHGMTVAGKENSGGAMRRYAPEGETAECSLLSLDWIVGAEGRTRPGAAMSSDPWNPDPIADGNSDHGITPVMRGADQPSFYPRLRQATVRVQSFERLAGRQLPPVAARYLPRYLQNGFDSPKETFLGLNDGVPTPLKFSDEAGALPPAGDRGGGVAQPHLSANAISRKFGPTFLPYAAAATSLTLGGPWGPVRLASADPRVAQVTVAALTNADPPQHLLDNAKILGLELKQLINLATLEELENKEQAVPPKLRETLKFGVAGGAAQALCTDLQHLIGEFDKEIDDKSKSIEAKGANLRILLSLYPDLEKSERELKEALKNKNEEEALRAIALAAEPARRFVAALGRAAADPLAPVREGARAACRRLLTALLLPDDRNARALLSSIDSLQSGFRDAIRKLLKSPDLVVWRRIVLGLPSVRPDLAQTLSDVDSAIDGTWAAAVDDVFDPATSLPAILADARGKFRSRLQEYLQGRLGSATAATKDEIERIKRSVNKDHDALAREFGASLSAIEASIPKPKIDIATFGDPQRLLEFLLQFGQALVAIAATQVPALVSTEVSTRLAEVCSSATEALTAVTASALPTAAERNALIGASTALTSVSRSLLRGVGDFETAIKLSGADWPAEVRQILEAWTARQRNSAGALDKRLKPAIDGLLAATDRIDPKDLVQRACHEPRTAPFSLVHDLDEARREVLESLRDVYANLHDEDTFGSVQLAASDIAGLRAAIERKLGEIANAPAETVRDLLKSLDKAIPSLRAKLELVYKAQAEATVLLLDASTVLGAVAQGADSVQAQALERVRTLLDSIRPALTASPELVKNIDAARAFFANDRLRQERVKIVSGVRAVTAAAESATLEQAGRALRKQVEDSANAHVDAIDAHIQRIRAILLGGSEEIVRSVVAGLAPVLVQTLDAVVRIDQQVVAARADAIRRLERNAAAPQEGEASAKDLTGLAMLLKLLPSSGKSIACHFFVTAAQTDPCPEGVDINPEQAIDEVARERDSIGELRDRLNGGTFDEATIAHMRELAEGWRSNGPAVARLVAQLLDLAQDILRGDLGRFISFADYKTKIETKLLSLLPSSSELEHTIGLTIEPPDFLKDIFKPQRTDPGKAKDLVIKTKSTIDLLPPTGGKQVSAQATTETNGTLIPFDVALLGPLKVATLKFSGATFTSVNGGTPSFRLAFESFKADEAIAFIEPLQKFLSPGETGPRVQPLKRGAGVEAGYGINLGIVSIGTVSFANVVLDAAAELPFDDSSAVFRVGLGRRDAPFLISAFPYTGGGFFALRATGGRINGFDASFEFGGGGAFRFGPLSGQGRLTTGIFIRQSGEGAYMDGFFYCGGSARIAFFGLSASLTVRTSLVNGDMAGEALFEFAFSLGIKDFKYHVQVWKRTPKGFRTAALFAVPTIRHASLDVSPATGRVPDTLFAMQAPVQLAALGNAGIDAACRPIPGAVFKVVAPPTPDELYACIFATAMCQSQDWDTYESYFDFGSNLLDPRVPTR